MSQSETIIAPNMWVEVATASGLRWAQGMVAEHHYLRSRVDPRCSPLAYLVMHQATWGAAAAAGPRCIGILIRGRPESTRCYTGGLTYGSTADVTAGRAQYDRWEILNLARVWFHPYYQVGGLYADEVPGFVDRRGVRRSTLASTAVRAVLARVGADYLLARPPVDCTNPYQIRAVLSYCDTRIHRGALYQACGFQRARVNEGGIETWWTAQVAPLTPEQDAAVRVAADRSPRSRRIRAERAQLGLPL